MKIVDVVLSAGGTGFFTDDQRAIKRGAGHDGFSYLGEPVTPGFRSIRQAGESISVMLVLEDGQVAQGDCCAVQYSGAGGRDPLFLAADYIPVIEEHITPRLVGRELTSFRELAEEVDHLVVDGKPLHTAVRYGVTQAILDAVAKANHVTMAEVVREEYNTGAEFRRVPIFAQTGDERYVNVDKMVIKGVEVIPHGLVNNVGEKLGRNGEKLIEFIQWIKARVTQYRQSSGYMPTLHFDVYGTIGLAFDNDVDRMADYLAEVEKAAAPLHVRIEGPMDVENREDQARALRELRDALRKRDIKVELVADEWCNTLEDIRLFVEEGSADMIQIKTPDLGGVNNTIEAILFCKENGVGAYCGGSCNETDRSGQVCTNIAIACDADQCLAKPGMGVDEGYMVVSNEMNRVIALERTRKAASSRSESAN